MHKFFIQFCLTMLMLALPMLASASPISKSPISNYERQIVAACLVLEASSEGVEGMQAVLNVIYNRAEGDLKRVVPVVVKRGQFSSLNSVTGKRQPDYSKLLRRAYRHNNFNDAMKLVRMMERHQLGDITFGATHFHAAGAPPYWVSSMEYLTTIGSHHFYTTRPVSYQASN